MSDISHELPSWEESYSSEDFTDLTFGIGRRSSGGAPSREAKGGKTSGAFATDAVNMQNSNKISQSRSQIVESSSDSSSVEALPRKTGPVDIGEAINSGLYDYMRPANSSYYASASKEKVSKDSPRVMNKNVNYNSNSGVNTNQKQYQQPSTTHNSSPGRKTAQVSSYHAQNDINNNQQDDLYYVREFIFSLSDLSKSQAEYLTKLSTHVDAEGDLDIKTISDIANYTFRSRAVDNRSTLLNGSSALSRESYLANEAHSDLDRAIKRFVDSVQQCILNRKNAYASQVRNLRDNCNLAIRKAIQSERADSAASISQLREQMKRSRDGETAELQKQIQELESAKNNLQSKYLESSTELREARLSIENAAMDRDNAVNAALKEMRDVVEKEKLQTAKLMMAEHQRVKDDASKQIEAISRQMQSQMENQERKEQEIKAILVNDKEKMQKECEQLRHQYMALSAQMTSEKERFQEKLKELKVQHERELHHAQAEGLREVALMKSKMSELVLSAQSSETKLKTEIESILAKERAVQEEAYANDMEKKDNLHKNELRRLQAQLEVRHKEDLARACHMHEQELKRVLRDNDRLQRLIGKSNIGHASKYLQSMGGISSSSAGVVHESAPEPSLLPQPVESYMRSVSGSASDLNRASISPPRVSTNVAGNNTSSSRGGNSLSGSKLTLADVRSNDVSPATSNRWGKLNESLYSQENRKGLSNQSTFKSKFEDPPDNLLLSEAFEVTKRSSHNQSSKSEGNVNADSSAEDSLTMPRLTSNGDNSDDSGDSIDKLNSSALSRNSAVSRNADNLDSYLSKLQQYLDGGAI